MATIQFILSLASRGENEKQWEPGWTNGPRETAERSVSRLPSVKSNITQQQGYSGLGFQNKITNIEKEQLHKSDVKGTQSW